MGGSIQEETERVLHALKQEIARSGLTIRAIERKAGVSYTVFQKVLAGSTSLQFHHILHILQALGLSWTQFFNQCYPQPQAEEKPPPPPRAPTEPEPAVTMNAVEERLRQLLKLAGIVLPDNLPKPAP